MVNTRLPLHGSQASYEKSEGAGRGKQRLIHFPGGFASPLGSKGDREKETWTRGVEPLIPPFTGLWRQTKASGSERGPLSLSDRNAEQP